MKILGHDQFITQQQRETPSVKAENAELKARLERLEKALESKK